MATLRILGMTPGRLDGTDRASQALYWTRRT